VIIGTWQGHDSPRNPISTDGDSEGNKVTCWGVGGAGVGHSQQMEVSGFKPRQSDSYMGDTQVLNGALPQAMCDLQQDSTLLGPQSPICTEGTE
jgi:hypothetical protein